MKRLDEVNGQATHAHPGRAAGRVAYLMSHFPKLTETFVLYEILAVEAQGLPVEIYPLMGGDAKLVHGDALPLMRRAHYTPFLSPAIVGANLRLLGLNPSSFMSTVRTLVQANWGSPRYLGMALLLFPKAVFFAQAMVRENVGHIHAHFASHPAMVAYVIKRLTGIPYSFTAHGSDIHRDQHMLLEKVREAEFVVAISEYNREFILEQTGGEAANRLVVIHCGVDTACFRPAAGSPSPNGRPLQLLCLGSLHEVKGQSHLIQAMRLLRQRGIPAVARFVGDGPDRAMLERQSADAGLNGAALFLGPRTREQVIDELQQSDVLVAPSVPSRDGRREGIPVALMEAMACGLPVVASRLSGIPELVTDEETGLLTAPGAAEEIAGAIERLYRSPELRQRLGQAARRRVVSEFDLNRNAAILAGRIREARS
jgi:glycosyltransferase involved in cell wall biosynthesis